MPLHIEMFFVEHNIAAALEGIGILLCVVNVVMRYTFVLLC